MTQSFNVTCKDLVYHLMPMSALKYKYQEYHTDRSDAAI